MADEVKVPVTPEVAVVDPIIDNPRAAIETAVITENETVPEVTQDEPTPSKPKDESPEPKVESDVTDSDIVKIKQSVIDKRIGKAVAKQKSAEERLAEAEAEIARLKTTPKAETPDPKDDVPPTIDQVEAYIIKCKKEGDVENEVKATRYLIQLEKDAAVKAITEQQNKVSSDAKAQQERVNKDLTELAKDYVAYDTKGEPDMKSDLTLSNQKGKLFEVSMGLYNDPELRAQYYNDPNPAMGYRRAVADAYREIHQQNLLKTPKVEVVEALKRTPRTALADPGSSDAEDTFTQSNANNLSDAEKVREEIKQRNKIRNSRRTS